MSLLKRKAAALAATVGLVALPAVASAGTIVQFSTDGVTWATICSSALTSCSGSASALGGQLTITLSGITSNSPGNSVSSDIFTATTQLQYTGAGVAEIVLRYASDGYTSPTRGLLESNLGGTGTQNGAITNIASFTSCAIVGSIGTAPPPASDVPCPGGITTPTITNLPVNVPSFNSSDNAAVTSVGVPYMLAENLDVHIASGATLNFANSTDLVSSPEPASIVLMGTGLIGLVGFVRRRTSQI